MTLTGTVWRPIGPSPIGAGGRQDNGLVSSIAISPADANVIYQGTAGGGVWRTLDGGAGWTPIFDRQLSLGIGEPGAIAIDPNDTSTLYVGTSARVTPQTQAGLFKSTDGGASCVLLGSGYPDGNTGDAIQFVNQWVNVVIVDPADSQTLYLGSTSGVFRSTDGGLNWTLGAGAAGDARSLRLDTSSPTGARVLYAGISGQGVVRSADGGQNWAPVLDGATAAVAAALGGTPGAGFGKVVVDLAPPASPPVAAGVQVLYAALEGTGGAPDPVGLFLSTNAGTTWTQRAATGMPTRTQGGYSFHMAVDPASPGDGANDVLYLGAVGQARSADSGATFTGLAGIHADTHAWAFAPQPSPTPTTVYCGTDGGLFRSTDDGATWTTLNAGGLQTGLFYNLALKPDASASVTLGALQDNGLQTTAGTTAPGWSNPQGGDGWDIAYDGVTAGQAYGSSGFWSPAPCTRVWRSTDDGASWSTDVTPWGTASDGGCYLAWLATDPSAAGIVYASGNANLWQSRDGGTTWRNIGAVPGVPAVAPTDGDTVAVASGSSVFVTTNALAATVGGPSGVTFTDITRDLPGRPVQRVAIDPKDPTVVYAVLGGFGGGHVLRTTVGGTAWEDISPAVDVPFGAIALDGDDTPTTIYVGNDFGVLRSVDDGATWTVLDDLHFPRAPVTELVLSRQGGVLRAATYGRGVFEFRRPKGPAIAVNLEDGLRFGTVCDGPAYLTLQVFNVGGSDLVITSVQRLMGAAGFRVLSSPGAPVVLRAGEEIDFTIEYAPSGPGSADTATIRIVSNDPGAPAVDLQATGAGGVAALELAVPDRGDFGEVCVGSFVDRGLVLNNRGPCPLDVLRVTSSSPDFVVPRVSSFPLVVAAGDSVELPIRFQPRARGPATATITVLSNDPDGAKAVRVTGLAPSPRLVVSIADAGDFGAVCVGTLRDEPVTVSNSGDCTLAISGISSSSSEFIVPDVDAYPLTIAPGCAVELQVRFQPATVGAKSATLTIESDDPGGPRTLALSGTVPSGRLAVTGSGHFGGVDFGRRAERTLSICNVGDCDLHVSRVAFRPDPWRPGCRDCDGCDCRGRHDEDEAASDQCCATFKIVGNPFPATVRPGSCLGVTLRYTPSCEGRACCELVVESDDPAAPETTVYVTGRLHRTLGSALKCWAAEELQELLRSGGTC